MFVSFSLNALLIPHYAALGSAIANVSALFSSMILHLIFAYKQLNISFKPQFYLRLITFSLSVLGIAYVTFELGFEWWKNLGVFVFLSLIIAFFLRLLNIREIYFILSKREKELVVEE